MQPLNKQQGGNTLGVFDCVPTKMDALIAAGFGGGGSLIYSNVFMPPPDGFLTSAGRFLQKRRLAPIIRLLRKCWVPDLCHKTADPAVKLFALVGFKVSPMN